jgi:hypothetical protein
VLGEPVRVVRIKMEKIYAVKIHAGAYKVINIRHNHPAFYINFLTKRDADKVCRGMNEAYHWGTLASGASKKEK